MRTTIRISQEAYVASLLGDDEQFFKEFIHQAVAAIALEGAVSKWEDDGGAIVPREA